MPSVYSSASIQLPFPSISDSPAADLLMPTKIWGFGGKRTCMYIQILGEQIVLGLFQALNSTCLLFPSRHSCWSTTPKRSTLLIFSWDGEMADKLKCSKDSTCGKKGAAQSVTTFWYRRSRQGHKISLCLPPPLEYSYFPLSHQATAAEGGSNGQEAVFYQRFIQSSTILQSI